MSLAYVHVDIKYLPQMPDESQRRYLFVAIDRATCRIPDDWIMISRQSKPRVSC